MTSEQQARVIACMGELQQKVRDEGQRRGFVVGVPVNQFYEWGRSIRKLDAGVLYDLEQIWNGAAPAGGDQWRQGYREAAALADGFCANCDTCGGVEKELLESLDALEEETP